MAFKAVLARSDALLGNPKSNIHLDCASPTSSPHFISHTPLHTPEPHQHTRVLGLLTPVPSLASLPPSAPHQHPPTRSSVLFQPSTPRTPTRLSIRRSIPRSPATLALSLHVSSPTGIPDSMSRSSSPPLRPVSPRPDYIPRPPSRSECLLRDTLRRVEQYERHQARPVRSPNPRPLNRQRKDSYMGPVGSPNEFTDGECECDEDPELHPAKPTGSFDFLLFRGQQPATAPRLVRRRSASRSSPDARHYPYGSPSSPSPMPPLFVRTRTAPAVPTADVMPRDSYMVAPRPQRASISRPLRHSMPSDSSQGSHSNSSSIHSSPPLRPVALSPHEAVLRARLEGVLQRAGVQPGDEDSKVSKHPVVRTKGTHGRSKSHSVSVVRPSVGDVDWSLVAGPRRPESISALGPRSNSKARSIELGRRRYATTSSSNTPSPTSPTVPITPPPTPPFNARTALEVCKRMDGYVSFASIEGLGEPPGMDIDADDAGDHSVKWTRWLRVWPFGNTGTTHDADTDTGTRGESQEWMTSR